LGKRKAKRGDKMTTKNRNDNALAYALGLNLLYVLMFSSVALVLVALLGMVFPSLAHPYLSLVLLWALCVVVGASLVVISGLEVWDWEKERQKEAKPHHKRHTKSV